MEIKQEKRGSLIIKGKQSSLTVIDFQIQTESLTISSPGEYEVGGIQIVGLAGSEKTNFKITVDGVKIGLIYGGVSDKQEEIFSNIEVLILLILDKASQLVVKLEPKMVVISGIGDPSVLTRELGKEVKETQRLIIKKESLPQELEVVWLKSM
ncbi:hypothetical protein HYW66_02375 [Candidatus Microgenomates bacterium]|nr:hypothetical protein [Candidatus Microgenomates bacterium]